MALLISELFGNCAQTRPDKCAVDPALLPVVKAGFPSLLMPSAPGKTISIRGCAQIECQWFPAWQAPDFGRAPGLARPIYQNLNFGELKVSPCRRSCVPRRWTCGPPRPGEHYRISGCGIVQHRCWPACHQSRPQSVDRICPGLAHCVLAGIFR